MAGELTVPRQDSLIETDENSPTRKDPFIASAAWLKMFFDPLALLLASVVKVAKATSLAATTQAAVLATSAYLTTKTGVYRVSYVIRVTRPASTSSALQVTIGWLRGGVAQTKVGASLTGNVMTTYEVASFPIRADGLTDITFEVSYGSVGATALQYEIDVIVEPLA